MDIQKVSIFALSVLILVGAGYALVWHADLSNAVQVAFLAAIGGVIAYWFSHSTNRPAD